MPLARCGARSITHAPTRSPAQLVGVGMAGRATPGNARKRPPACAGGRVPHGHGQGPDADAGRFQVRPISPPAARRSTGYAASQSMSSCAVAVVFVCTRAHRRRRRSSSSACPPRAPLNTGRPPGLPQPQVLVGSALPAQGDEEARAVGPVPRCGLASRSRARARGCHDAAGDHGNVLGMHPNHDPRGVVVAPCALPQRTAVPAWYPRRQVSRLPSWAQRRRSRR